MGKTYSTDGCGFAFQGLVESSLAEDAACWSLVRSGLAGTVRDIDGLPDRDQLAVSVD